MHLKSHCEQVKVFSPVNTFECILKTFPLFLVTRKAIECSSVKFELFLFCIYFLPFKSYVVPIAGTAQKRDWFLTVLLPIPCGRKAICSLKLVLVLT